MRGRSIVVSALAAVLILATAGEALATVCVTLTSTAISRPQEIGSRS